MNLEKITILIADDDEEDQGLIRDAILHKGDCGLDIRFVNNGEELLDYLYRKNQFANDSPRPSLILLDLKMPKKGGIEAIKEIKENWGLKDIPVIILSSSGEEKDITSSYKHGVNSYIVKPIGFNGMIEAMKRLQEFWIEVAELPEDFFIGDDENV